MDVVKLGMVGCGTHASNNIFPMLRYTNAQIVAVCDLDASLAQRNAQLFATPEARVFTDPHRMLKEAAIDAVMVVGPPSLHYEVGCAALRKSMPVFVEKPTASNYAQTLEMVETAHAHDTFVMTGFTKCFATTYHQIGHWIHTGKLVANAAQLRYLSWSSRDVSSVLWYMAIHPVALLVDWFGIPLRLTATMHFDASALTLGLTMHFSQGRFAHLIAGGHGPRIQERAEITGIWEGRDALITVENLQHMEVHTAGQSGIDVLAPLSEIQPRFEMQDIQLWRPDFAIPNVGQRPDYFHGYIPEVRAFVEAVRTRSIPRCANQACLPAMRIIQMLHDQPWESGTIVDLPVK